MTFFQNNTSNLDLINEVVDIVKNLRLKAGGQEDLFGMIFNLLTIEVELLDFYRTIWSKTSQENCNSVEDAKKERNERIMLSQKMIFIQIMSDIEFCFKEYIENFPDKIGNCQDRNRVVYLSRIMQESKNKSIITNEAFERWNGVIKLRNALVHNNGISKTNQEFSYPKCTLNLKTGEMIRGDLKLFPYLIDWLLDESKQWIIGMEKNNKVAGANP